MEVRWLSEQDMIRDMKNIDFNKITSLIISLSDINIAVLPPKLKSLHCPFNKLISLPDLPKTLEYLHCGYNRLTSLPKLPDGLQTLKCQYNQLTTLPLLPNSLNYLDCSYNQLSFLPRLPADLKYLDCRYNRLTYCLSQLPVDLNTLLFVGNMINVCKDLDNELINASIDSDYIDLIADKILIFKWEIYDLQSCVNNNKYYGENCVMVILPYRKLRDKILEFANNIMSHYEIVL